ncbi:MAG: tetratricopeptide repeat protein [Lentisphaeria bacterium]|nr:tetratricopeptide repeat protein [Lentisphaeria bacterium]
MARKKTSHRQKTGKKLNVKLLVALLMVPVLFLVAAVIVGFMLHGGDSIERLTRRNDPAYYIEKGDRLMEAGDYALAAKQYKQAMVEDSGDTRAMLRLISALEKEKPDDQDKAARNDSQIIGLLYRVTEVDQDDIATQEKLLNLLYEGVKSLGQKELAEQLLTQAEKFYENHPERTFALRYRALARIELMKQRDFSDLERVETYEDLKRALELFPGDKAVISGLSIWNALEASRLSAEEGRDVDADRYQTVSEEILIESLAKNPGDLETKLQLARTFFAHGKKEKGLALLTEMETELLVKPDPKVSAQVANFLVAADQEPSVTPEGVITTSGLMRADAVLAVALTAHPKNVEISFSLATVKKKLGQQDEAIRLLKQTLESADGKGGGGVEGMLERRLKFAATTELANTYLVMAEKTTETVEREKAIGEAEIVIKQLGQDMRGSALVDLLEGKIALLRGKNARAIQKFEVADKKFDGRNPEAVFLSAVALQREGEIGAAIQRLERLSAGALNDQVRLRTERELANLYMRAGNLALAKRKIDKALSLSTEDQASLVIKSEIMDRQRQRRTMGATESDTGSGIRPSVDLLKPLVEAGDVRARLQLARLYQENKQLDEAVGVLEEGVRTDPENVVLLQQLVRLDVMMGQKDRAVERLDTAIEAMPDNRLLPLLRQQVIGGEQTVEMLEALLKEMDDPFQSALGLYTLYKNSDRTEEAAAALAKAAELRPDDEKVLNAQFGEAISAKDWTAAQAVCDRVADLDLDMARGAFWQGRLEMARQQYIRAASSFQTGVRRRPLFSNGWLMLGDSHRLAGSLAEAENAYQEAIRLKPDNVTAIYNLFLVHDARGMRQAAMDDLARARQLAPNDRRIGNAYLAYLGNINPKEALKARLAFMEKAPDDWRNRLATADLLRKTGEPRRALELLTALYQEYPDSLSVALALAEHYRQTGHVDKGRDTLENYVDGKKDAATLSDWLTFARFLLTCELPEPAVAAYEEAARLEDPVDREATRELGDWYFNNQFFAKALPLYERAHENSKDDLRLTLRFIETLIYNNKSERAGALLDEYVLVHGKNPQTSLLQCIIAIETKRFDRAATFAEEAVQLGPTNPQAYLYRARLNYLKAGASGDKRGVIRDLEKSLALDSSLLAAREMLVDCYLSDQPAQVDRAIGELQLIVKQKPEASQARVRLINVLMANNRLTDAAAQIEDAIRLTPALPVWYSLRAALLQQQGKHTEAIPDMKRLFEVSKTSQNLARLANGYVTAEQPAEALKLLDAYAGEVAGDPMLLAVKGRAQAMTGNTDMARISFDMAFSQAAADPAALQQLLRVSNQLMPEPELVKILDRISSMDKTGMARMYAGELLLRSGKTTDGIARMEDVRKTLPKSHPNMPRLLHSLAAAYQKVEKYQEAARVYEELTVLTPKDFVAFNNLAYLLCEYLDRAEEAVKAGEQALALAPADDKQKSNVLDTLGWAYFKHGDLDNARVRLAESVRYDPSLHNQYHLALVLAEKGFTRDARAQLRNLRRTAQKMSNTEFEEKAEKLLSELN